MFENFYNFRQNVESFDCHRLSRKINCKYFIKINQTVDETFSL